MGKRLTAAQIRVQDLVKAVIKKKNGGAIKAPEVVFRIVNSHWSSVYQDIEVARHLIQLGLDDIVRPILNQWKDVGDELHDDVVDDDISAADQLELWPKTERALAAQLEGLVRAYVPSRQAHVPIYDPELITDDELAEAGEYRITHGAGAIRTGNVLIQIAALRRKARGGSAKPSRKVGYKQELA